MITGFVSIKFVSYIIGPVGIALVGQFLNFITALSTLGTGGISTGVTKYVAEYGLNPIQQRKFINHSVVITLFSTGLVSALTILFSQQIGSYIFKTNQYTSLIVLAGATIGLYSFNTLFVNIINGFKEFKRYVRVNIVASLVALLISIFLVVNLKLYGALLNCVVSQSVIIFVTLFFIYKQQWFKDLFSGFAIEKKILRQLGGFSLIVLVSSLIGPLSQILVRNNIIDNSGLITAGHWEGMNRLSGMYLNFITASIGVYYLPRLSEIQKREDLQAEIFKTFKIILPPLVLMCVLIYLSRGILIHLIFTKEFISIENLFAPVLIGDVFKIASWIISYQLVAKAMVKEFIITEIIYNVMFVSLSILGLKLSGLALSILLGYTVSYIVYFLMMIYLFRKTLFISWYN